MHHTRMLLGAIAATFVLISFSQKAQAHCQIPCGIYDDHARVESMLEDVATIWKAVTLINELAGQTDPQSMNQIVRWVVNKEQHAQNIIDSISDYFLTQRVKASQEDYAERLQRHHAIIVAAMHAKQHSDMETVEKLQAAIEAIAQYYPE